MAAMSSTGMDNKLQQKGKLMRPDRDKKSRQQEAYKWRDARRVYLAGSFDRWKRLRSKLGLKDSRLAWHLLEAHANHCVECGMMDGTDNEATSKDFYPALVKSVRKLCQKHFSFKHSVEVVGLLCLNVDNEEKENYSIKELIQRPIGLRVEALSSDVNKSSRKETRPPLGNADINVGESETSLDGTGEERRETENLSQHRVTSEVTNDHAESLEYFSEDDDEGLDADITEPDTSTDNISETVSSSQENGTTCIPQSAFSQSIVNLENMEILKFEQQNVFSNTPKCLTKKMNKEEFSFVQMTPQLLFSEFSTLYPNISMRTFYRWKKEIADGMDFIRQNDSVNFSQFQKVYPEVSEEVFMLWKKLLNEQSHKTPSPKNVYSCLASDKETELSKGNNFLENVPNSEEAWTVQKIDSNEKIKLLLKNNPTVSCLQNSVSLDKDVDITESCNTVKMTDRILYGQHCDTNMNEDAEENFTSNMKEPQSSLGNKQTESDNEIQNHVSIRNKTECDSSESAGAFVGTETNITNVFHSSTPVKMELTDSEEELQIHMQDQLDSPKRKLEMEADAATVSTPLDDSGHMSVVDGNNMNVMTNGARKKRKYSTVDGIQHRREVYQKEEYELLEAMPFADYAEFSRHCPNVMKRTYFRWKRRIKEEYMHLEQNADMSFEEFSRVFPQAKQNIFSHWKSLIKEGYNFSTVHYTSDSSSHVSSGSAESGELSEDTVKQTSYNFLQKNYQMEFLDFSKHFPTVTQQTFSVWKKKIQHEVQFLMSNPYYEMDYAVYSQCFPGVSKEVFNAWKMNMKQQLGSPQSGAGVYPGTSYWSPFLGQTAGFGAVPWSDVKPGLWMNNPLLTHMWGTAMNLSALARKEDAGKQQLNRSSSSPVDRSDSPRHIKSSQHSVLQSPSEVGNTSAKNSPFSQTEMDFASPRSRKQNKAEFYHFLQHPEMDFHDMSVAFPNLSLRTFYRWKREIKNAMCILEESQSTTFSEFHIYFPDIPVDIFNKWKEKIYGTSRENKASATKESLKSSASNCSSESAASASERNDVIQKGSEFHFLEANPYISFSQFSVHFPHTTMKTFNTWYEEIQSQMNLIRKNPSISNEEFRQHFPDITDDVFKTWKDLALSERVPECESESLQINFDGSPVHNHSPAEDIIECDVTPSDLSIKQENSNDVADEYPQRERMLASGMHTRLAQKASRPEYIFLQNNPTVDFRDFFFRFPEVSGTTFYRWRREIKEIMDYIQLKPNATYNEIVSYFPEISEDIFANWKSIIQSGSGDQELSTDQDPMGSLQAMVDSRSQDDTQEAFCHVMENPDIDKEVFSQKFPSLSQKIYYKWKKKVKELLLLLHSNPEMDYNKFTSCCSDVPEEVFIRWKDNLSYYLDKAVSSGLEEPTDLVESKLLPNSDEWISPKSRKVNQAEFLFFLMNPFMDYQEFSNNFPQISLRTFYRWRRETRDGLEYLEEYPDVSYRAFCQMFPVVPEDVFQKWKMLIAVRNKVKNKAYHQKEKSASYTRNSNSPTENCSASNNNSDSISSEHILNSFSSSDSDAKVSTSLVSSGQDSNSDQEKCKGISQQTSDSSGSFIGFLSAAVENICKSAGLPPLDHSNSETPNSRQARAGSLAITSLKLGGVAFPGLIPPTEKASPNMSNLDSEQQSVDGEPSGLGGVAFPGMTPTSCYLADTSVNNSASSLEHPQTSESDVNSHSVSRSSSSAVWSFERQVSKSDSLSSSPTNELISTVGSSSRMSSPSFSLEKTSVGRGTATRTESPTSSLKSAPSGKNGLHDDYFFSPRLRKQNREEYMYLQQNPSMDFQEFFKVYPTISLRTFYRWKREFREDGHLGSFHQKENTNTLNTGGAQHGQILDLSAKAESAFNHSVDAGVL